MGDDPGRLRQCDERYWDRRSEARLQTRRNKSLGGPVQYYGLGTSKYPSVGGAGDHELMPACLQNRNDRYRDVVVVVRKNKGQESNHTQPHIVTKHTYNIYI